MQRRYPCVEKIATIKRSGYRHQTGNFRIDFNW
jgi:hypothetical protein